MRVGAIASPHQTPRWRLRVSVPAAVALLCALLLLLQPMVTAAGRGWCRTDPSFFIDDRIIHVDVASYEEIFAATTGPVKIKLKIPKGVTAGVFHLDPGFGYGYDIDIERVKSWPRPKANDPIQVAAEVFVPASGELLPVLVTLTDETRVRAEMEGETKEWVKLRAKI